MKSKKTYISILTSVLILFSLAACKPSEKNGKKGLSVNTEGVETPNMTAMIKDAIRLKGTIDAVETLASSGNVYIFTVTEVVKYGATFATVEPKVGEKLSLSTPATVRYDAGQQVIVDVTTPFEKVGSLLAVVMANN